MTTMPAIILLCLFSAQPPSTPAGPSVRVMSFNIRYGKAPDGDNRWEMRRDVVIETIREHHPDMVGLQEALRFQLDEMERGLPQYREIGVARENGQDKGEYNTILYRADRLRPEQQGNFWYSDTPSVPGSRTWGNRLPRLCTWSRFVGTGDLAGAPAFYYFNTHLDHESQPSRVKSAALLADRIAARTSPDPAIVSGDFNVGEDNVVVALLTGKEPWPTTSPADAAAKRRPVFTDTFRKLHPDAKGVGTFNGFAGRRTGDKIDYILTTPEVRIIEAEILRDNRDGRYPSDHFPLLSVVKMPARQNQVEKSGSAQ